MGMQPMGAIGGLILTLRKIEGVEPSWPWSTLEEQVVGREAYEEDNGMSKTMIIEEWLFLGIRK
jgi:hypothetical protein